MNDGIKSLDLHEQLINKHETMTFFSLGPHCVHFRMRKFKPQVAKVSTVYVEKTFALVAQHSERRFESPLSSSPNWLLVI